MLEIGRGPHNNVVGYAPSHSKTKVGIYLHASICMLICSNGMRFANICMYNLLIFFFSPSHNFIRIDIDYEFSFIERRIMFFFFIHDSMTFSSTNKPKLVIASLLNLLMVDYVINSSAIGYHE
jgi:hypothetical protein